MAVLDLMIRVTWEQFQDDFFTLCFQKKLKKKSFSVSPLPDHPLVCFPANDPNNYYDVLWTMSKADVECFLLRSENSCVTTSSRTLKKLFTLTRFSQKMWFFRSVYCSETIQSRFRSVLRLLHLYCDHHIAPFSKESTTWVTCWTATMHIAAQVGYLTFGKEAPFKDVRQRGCVDAPLFYSLLRKLIFFKIESLGGVRPCSAQPAAALHVCVQREQFVRGKNLRVCASRHQRG